MPADLRLRGKFREECGLIKQDTPLYIHLNNSGKSRMENFHLKILRGLGTLFVSGTVTLNFHVR